MRKLKLWGSQTDVWDLKMPVFGAVGLKIRLGECDSPQRRGGCDSFQKIGRMRFAPTLVQLKYKRRKSASTFNITALFLFGIFCSVKEKQEKDCQSNQDYKTYLFNNAIHTLKIELLKS